MDKAAPDPLLLIRKRIDQIDEAMHRLLIDRSSVIAELIEIKGTSKPGTAFRPDREADMMRRIVLRHSGGLPLVTVEHIWREIITTFTAMQAPFGVVAGPAKDALAMRDLVRFYFGFSVPVRSAKTNGEAIEAVARSRKDVAVVIAGQKGRQKDRQKGRWWEALKAPTAPKIFAKLPFIEIPGRPADLPAYVIGPPLKQTLETDNKLFALPESRGLKAALAAFGGEVLAAAEGELLAVLPVAATLDDLREKTGASLGKVREIGGFFSPIRLVAERVA